jgi:parallel beta-helix repeat protein
MLITISLILISYQWLLKYSPQTQEELENSLPQKEGCLKIESIDVNNKMITVRNCGDKSLSNFVVYLDSEPIANYSGTLAAGGIAQISYSRNINFGNHEIFVSSNYVQSPRILFSINCDFYIYQSNIISTYLITQSNKLYCLAENVYIGGEDAIDFVSDVHNTILECQNYNINSNQTSDTFGVLIAYGDYTTSNTIKNCNISNFDAGIYTNAKSSIIINNTVKGNTHGIHLYFSENNTLINNTATSNQDGIYIYSSTNNILSNNIGSNNRYGIELFQDSNNNILSNNIVNSNTQYGIQLWSNSNNNIISNNIVNSNTQNGIYLWLNSNNNIISNNIVNSNLRGIYLSSSSNNTVTGGSVALSTSYDYYLNSLDMTNFINTNFTSERIIYFNDATSWFNYQNDSSQSMWLKTKVSADTWIRRKLLNWNQTLVQWNDTSSDVTATYNITGLLTNANYSVYNNSIAISGSPFNSSSTGQINFVINLIAGKEINIKVNTTATFNAAPQYFQNSTNSTIAGKPTLFSLKWTDDIGLSGYIFSFDNGNGTMVNDSWVRLPAGTDNRNFLGSTTVQSGTGCFMEANQKWGYQVTATDSGNVTRITWYLQKDVSGTSNVLLGLYDDNGMNAPNNLLGSCGPVVATTTYQWLSCNLNGITIIKNSKYWITFLPETDNVYFRCGSGAGYGYEYTDAYSDGMSNPWGTPPGTLGTSYFPESAYVNFTLINVSWSNVTKTINSTIGSTIRWCVYANDTSNNWNYSSCSNPFSLTTSDSVLNLNFNEATGTIAHDSSVYGNDGTYYGETFNDGTSYSGSTPTDIHNASGVYGKALSFDGSNDYVNVSDSSSLSVSNITITAWIYPLSFGGANLGRIVDKYQSYEFYVANDTGGPEALRLAIFNSTGWGSCDSNSHSISLNARQHVTVTYDGKTIRFYVNGTLQGSCSAPVLGPLRVSSSNLYIGYNSTKYDANTRAFNGTIDEVRIWNRTLSQAEIQAEMNSFLPVKRPIASYSFEEPNGATYVNDTHIWVNGTYGSALSFDGSNDYVLINNNLNTPYITGSAWIKIPSYKAWQDIIAKYFSAASDTGSWYFEFNGTGNGVYACFNISGSFDSCVDSVSAIPLNTWTHVAFVMNGTHSMIYINGNLDNIEDTANGIVNDFPYPIVIGAASDGSNYGNYFNGTIDEVRIWNRTLSQPEIVAEMNKG